MCEKKEKTDVIFGNIKITCFNVALKVKKVKVF